ncbi:MAG: LapA family protein [Pseudomonadota bacterium]|jgi:putative membrane protein|nr:LapA family protein [Pseudomonadota bacterium]|tara:strand:+ start:1188 stop:1484 length:297 start_codon:yes stop_codon:yes gene_type:complete
MGRLFFLLFTILLTIIAVVISTLNVDSTSIDLYIETYDLPLSIIILFAFITGMLTTVIYLISIVIAYKRKTREMKIALDNNREELDNLRRNPLRDGTE